MGNRFCMSMTTVLSVVGVIFLPLFVAMLPGCGESDSADTPASGTIAPVPANSEMMPQWKDTSDMGSPITSGQTWSLPVYSYANDPKGTHFQYYASGLPNVAQLEDGVIKWGAGAKPGTYPVRVVATDGYGLRAETTFTFVIK